MKVSNAKRTILAAFLGGTLVLSVQFALLPSNQFENGMYVEHKMTGLKTLVIDEPSFAWPYYDTVDAEGHYHLYLESELQFAGYYHP